MSDDLKLLGEKIINEKEVFAESITEKITSGRSYLDEEKVRKWRIELFQFLGDIFIKDENTVLEEIRPWMKSIADSTVSFGLSIDEAMNNLPKYRSLLWDFFETQIKESDISASAVLQATKKVDVILEEIMKIYSRHYVQQNERLMKAAQESIQELSVPVVPIAGNIAVLPITGEIDTHRAKMVMEKSLEQSRELKLKYLIIDVSGVPMVDTMVSHHIFQVINALRLLGVEAILTGLSPAIAQTVVSLGVNFSNVKTFATLQQALVEIGIRYELDTSSSPIAERLTKQKQNT
ncbi:STAS domain-containing protein [Bacillus sp. FJAT-44742]|uniref:STAS domain-containing protein n=1 Tax=Bacillus sp. FJAT-44742 TaxID=2014005 RepID=UPI000C239FE3|nr:STAS domain-containing protein [Bacillus sp. FJAT-44742]